MISGSFNNYRSQCNWDNKPQTRTTKSTASITSSKTVIFTGVVSRERIGDAYAQADIFINGSSVDAQPVSVIEAFRAGTPVVTTSPEAMPYLVEHVRTGLLSTVGGKGLSRKCNSTASRYRLGSDNRRERLSGIM